MYLPHNFLCLNKAYRDHRYFSVDKIIRPAALHVVLGEVFVKTGTLSFQPRYLCHSNTCRRLRYIRWNIHSTP